MKPKYIFGAVFLICVLLVTVLPRLGQPAAQAAPVASPLMMPVVEAQANLPTADSARPQPAEAALPAGGESNHQTPAVGNSAPEPEAAAPTAAPAPAAQTAAQAAQNLPSPADPAGAANQGLVSIPETSSLPSLEDFTASVAGGDGARLAGVYVPGQLALPILQQPAGDANFVDSNDHTVTEYSRSAAYNVVGLLAHNTLSSGQSFFRLKPGQDVILIYGSGRQARYRIDRIEHYQALSPTDPYSDFVDLNGPGGGLVPNEALFRRIYTHAGDLVFQTCFEANGDPSWGRRFVIARPL